MVNHDQRIKPVGPANFRSTLCLEDIKEDIAFGEYHTVTVPNGGTEQVLIMAEMPVKIPYFRKYFGLKIKSLTDPLLSKAVAEFLSINPGIDVHGLGKMTTFFVRYLSVQSPAITYETMYPVIVNIYNNPPQVNLIVDMVILFQRGSLIPAAERKQMSLQCRNLRNSKLIGEVLHNATQTVIETIPPELIVTKTKVMQESKNQGKEIKSQHTLRKHLKPETKQLFEEANLDRHFRTEKSLKKYKKFLALPPMSLDKYSAELGVSKSTIVKFKEIHDKESQG